jgi:membrane-bound serine protease (ClpP class)
MQRRRGVRNRLLGDQVTNPNAAFLLAVLGVLGIYIEFIWPGRILPGLLGAAALVCGCYFLARHSPSNLGLVLIGIALVLFIAESLYSTYFVAGAIATACLAIGARKLFNSVPEITAGVAIPASIVFGGVTIFLGSAGKRARRNKRSDIDHPR